jgi:hypothetical protein
MFDSPSKIVQSIQFYRYRHKAICKRFGSLLDPDWVCQHERVYQLSRRSFIFESCIEIGRRILGRVYKFDEPEACFDDVSDRA